MSVFAPSENNGKRNDEDNEVGIFARIYQEDLWDSRIIKDSWFPFISNRHKVDIILVIDLITVEN